MDPRPEDKQVDMEPLRSLVRRQSPRGFVINRAPKVKFGGGGKQKQMAPMKETASPALRGKKGVRRPQNTVRSGRGSPTQAVVALAVGIVEQSRRHRLILEQDLDDDMADLPQPKEQAIPLGQPTSRDTQPCPDQVWKTEGPNTGTAKLVKRRLRRNASKVVAADVGGVVDPAPLPVAEPRGARKSRQVRVVHGEEIHEQGDKAIAPLPTSHKGAISAGEEADESPSGASEAGEGARCGEVEGGWLARAK
ncbi:unnamed protein product [Linum trigynum]